MFNSVRAFFRSNFATFRASFNRLLVRAYAYLGAKAQQLVVNIAVHLAAADLRVKQDERDALVVALAHAIEAHNRSITQCEAARDHLFKTSWPARNAAQDAETAARNALRAFDNK